LQGDHQSSEITPVELIKSGEGQTVEFKSTARVNVHTGQADPRLEHVILKTVCGFLNAEGGTLFVGVDDEGNAVGIDPDLATLGSKANVDGYELFLRQLLETGLSVPTAATVRIRFEPIHNQTVCLVRTSASGRPVFAKPVKGQAGADTSEFWVRIGNQTRQLHGDDMVQYQSDHWG
jgi:predicted HTH transcriptional regulator